jgi:hypothetical protein
MGAQASAVPQSENSRLFDSNSSNASPSQSGPDNLPSNLLLGCAASVLNLTHRIGKVVTQRGSHIHLSQLGNNLLRLGTISRHRGPPSPTPTVSPDRFQAGGHGPPLFRLP